MPSTVFDHPIFPGAKTIKKTITVTNTSGAYSETITDDRISAGMQVNKMYIEDPSVFRSDISVQTLGGSFVFSCSDVVGTTDVTLEFLKIADDPNGITSTEFNVLNNRIDNINGNLASIQQVDWDNAMINISGTYGSLSNALTIPKNGFIEVMPFTGANATEAYAYIYDSTGTTSLKTLRLSLPAGVVTNRIFPVSKGEKIYGTGSNCYLNYFPYKS